MMRGAGQDPDQSALLAAAQLELYCQLMLGCPLEADQAVQETLLRGSEGLRQLAPRTSVRIWLYRLATNVCLESLEREE